MNKNVESIIKAYSTITNNHDIANIIDILSDSETFNEIANNNPAYLYEGYPSNLLEIVEELKQHENCPLEIFEITEESIVRYNKAQRALNSSSLNTTRPILVTALTTSGHVRPVVWESNPFSSVPKTHSPINEVIEATQKNIPLTRGSLVAAKKKSSLKSKPHFRKKRTTT